MKDTGTQIYILMACIRKLYHTYLVYILLPSEIFQLMTTYIPNTPQSKYTILSFINILKFILRTYYSYSFYSCYWR